MRTTPNIADRREPPPPQLLAERRPRVPLRDERRRIDRPRRRERRTETRARRVRPSLEPLAPARVRFARDQKRFEALGPPERVDGIEQLQHRRRPQILGAMDHAVMTRDVQREIAVRARDREPLAERLEQLDRALLV